MDFLSPYRIAEMAAAARQAAAAAARQAAAAAATLAAEAIDGAAGNLGMPSPVAAMRTPASITSPQPAPASGSIEHKLTPTNQSFLLDIIRTSRDPSQLVFIVEEQRLTAMRFAVHVKSIDTVESMIKNGFSEGDIDVFFLITQIEERTPYDVKMFAKLVPQFSTDCLNIAFLHMRTWKTVTWSVMETLWEQFGVRSISVTKRELMPKDQKKLPQVLKNLAEYVERAGHYFVAKEEVRAAREGRLAAFDEAATYETYNERKLVAADFIALAKPLIENRFVWNEVTGKGEAHCKRSGERSQRSIERIATELRELHALFTRAVNKEASFTSCFAGLEMQPLWWWIKGHESGVAQVLREDLAAWGVKL